MADPLGATLRAEARYLTMPQLAERWQIPESTLRYWRKAGEGGPQGVLIGGRVRYSLRSIEAHEASLERAAG